MKLFFLFSAIFFPILTIAQPDYPEPCDGNQIEEPYKDLNQDGKADLMMFISSEGTDDVPSSMGTCFYGFRFMDPKMGLLVPEDWDYLSGYTQNVHQDSARYIPSNASAVQPLLSMGYGNNQTEGWVTTLDRSEYYAFYYIDQGDTLLGWFEVEIDREMGVAQFGNIMIQVDPTKKCVSPGSSGPLETLFSVGWKHNPQVGLMAVDRGPVSARTVKGGIYAGYYAQYGLMISDILLMGFETSLNAEFYNWNAVNNLNLRWSANVHFIMLDFGFAFVNQNPLSSDLNSGLGFQWETGISLANYRMMFVFNGRSLDPDAQADAFPKYGLRLNYQF